MNQLINIQDYKINNQKINAVSARELHEFLEVNTKFSDWIKSRIEKYEFIEEQDYIRLSKKMEGNNATIIEYFISLNMAKELSMVENNEKGKDARKYFIECERQLQKPKTPQTYLEALEELVAVTKEKERIQSLNNALMHVQKSYVTSEVAKEIGFKSAKVLNQELHKKGIQYKQNDTWLLYSKYADMGLVEIKQGTTEKGHIYYNSQWTQKGRQFILALFGKV